MSGYDNIGERAADRILAVRKTFGVFSDIADRAGVSRADVCDWYENDEEFKLAVDSERERAVDVAEKAVMTNVEAGDLKAAYFVLSTIGKDRGWTEKDNGGSTSDFTYNITYETLVDTPRAVVDGQIVHLDDAHPELTE